jgi:hypothetical protein
VEFIVETPPSATVQVPALISSRNTKKAEQILEDAPVDHVSYELQVQLLDLVYEYGKLIRNNKPDQALQKLRHIRDRMTATRIDT